MSCNADWHFSAGGITLLVGNCLVSSNKDGFIIPVINIRIGTVSICGQIVGYCTDLEVF